MPEFEVNESEAPVNHTPHGESAAAATTSTPTRRRRTSTTSSTEKSAEKPAEKKPRAPRRRSTKSEVANEASANEAANEVVNQVSKATSEKPPTAEPMQPVTDAPPAPAHEERPQQQLPESERSSETPAQHAPAPDQSGYGSDQRRPNNRRERFRHRYRGGRRDRNRERGGGDRYPSAYGSPAEGGNYSGTPNANGTNEGAVIRVTEPQFAEGIVEVSGKGFGFLREAKRNFVQTPSDIFVTPEVCRRFNLRDGTYVKGEVRRSSRGPQMFRLTEIQGEDPEKFQSTLNFDELTTINPNSRVRLETDPERYTTRVIDMITPIGKGQRGLIVAPPRTGKTTLLQHIAEAVVKNHPEMKLIILLVDERPEEVTEIRRTVPQAEIFASSNDNDIKSHTKIAQLAIDRAKRLVEAKHDVFLILDSITRVGRAFNNALTGGGRTMSGGIDARALEIPRKIFAAARNTEEAGSLTIIASALIETGSKMDEVIFQEFKGTGNMELVLDRKISDMRFYPAVDIFQSGTRREELLLQDWELDKINVIRRGLAGHKPIEAIERLLSFLKKFPTNAQMLASLPG